MKKIKQLQNRFAEFCTKKGIPVPVVRDPVTQKPSASFTLLVVSAGLVIFGLTNKIVDIDNALQFFYACAGLYFGRKLSSDKKEE